MIKAKSLTSTITEKGYTILIDGIPWIIQEDYIPDPGATMAESAQNHIDAILAEQAAAEKAAKEPTESDVLGQSVAQLTLQNMQLNTTVDTLGAALAQAQLDIITLKGGTK